MPFYDLRRDPIVCPKCGAEVEAPPHGRVRLKRTPTGRDIEPALVETAAEDEIDDGDGDGDETDDDDETDDTEAAESAVTDGEPDDELDEPADESKSSDA